MQQEERDGDEPADRGDLRLLQRVPSRASPRSRSSRAVGSCTGRAPVWSTSARSFASLTDPMPVISAPFVPGMPFGLSLKSIVGERLDLAVEDDREVLRVVVLLAAGAAGGLPPRTAALGQRSRDALELLRALACVKSMSTSGWPLSVPCVPKSWRVPLRLRSDPVISGIAGLSAVACGWYLKR